MVKSWKMLDMFDDILVVRMVGLFACFIGESEGR